MIASVAVRRGPVTLPTYTPLPADKNPMFLEKRVYQGSSGKVYPLPFVDRIAEKRCDFVWDAIHLENEFVYVMILPQIGGRIHVGRDKTNGYDFFYRQDVIKPALVGLAGPWISGGVEFNWPQHHRPATFMPVEVDIENHEDGSITVWCGDHDPMSRMKGMHGICLYPGRSYIELKVRAYNRTQSVQTFLWWANVATRVHQNYQSFFPPDVYYVADHARRSMSEYPLCQDQYYGVDYAGRAKSGVPKTEVPSNYIPPNCGGKSQVDYPANDLSFYANIPVPTSYMCMGSKEDFFGGYDHGAQAGVVHIANHHISPGKKQWTWGNHEFGYAWDRSLTDSDESGEFAPYIEIMAGVYTDNQPDFAFLMPGETKTWSQYWYPIQKIGTPQHATLEAAINLHIEGGKARVGICVSQAMPRVTISIAVKGTLIGDFNCDFAPGASWVQEIVLPKKTSETDVRVFVTDGSGVQVLSYQPKAKVKQAVPPAAIEPADPMEIASTEELYITGLHLEQYRHATRDPMLYWREALRRDPGDSRCNNSVGLWHLRRGEFEMAETHFRKSIARLTLLNGNPYDGEPLFNLGRALCHLNRDDQAYDAYYKAVWNQPWQAAGYHALAELDCKRHDWSAALQHLDYSLRSNTDNLAARNLRVVVLRKLDRSAEAEAQLAATRALDRLDCWSGYLADGTLNCDTQTRLDLALDFARAGLYFEAIGLLQAANPEPESGTAPLVNYYLAWLTGLSGDPTAAMSHCRDAAKASSDYCFPARVEEIAILENAMRLNPKDARAPYYLGNLFYDRRRHDEAIMLWEKAARMDPAFSFVWRNLGIGYFNIAKQPVKARAAYDRAISANPADARLLYERDQLWKRLGEKPDRRLKELEKRRGLVSTRDDLSVELCSLYNQTGRHTDALALLSSRNFQPWEGGEGQALGEYVRAHLAIGRAALTKGESDIAGLHFRHALDSPPNLSEAKHLLANQSDIYFWLGVAFEKMGDKNAAKQYWKLGAEFRGDFQQMSVRAFSEMTYYSALSLEKLGQKAAARTLLQELLDYALELNRSPAKVDYFATSLPTMLLFEDDIAYRQHTTALFLEAQALFGLGHRAKARKRLQLVLEREPSHPRAGELLQPQPN